MAGLRTRATALRRWHVAVAFVSILAGCSTVSTDATPESTPSSVVPAATENPSTTASSTTAASTTAASTTASSTTALATTASSSPPLTRPEWLGQRPLPTDGTGFGIAQPTPAELIDRQLPTINTLPPPTGDEFVATIGPFVGEPLERSTWREGCPVPSEGLRYVTVSFRGFDGLPHTGELIVAERFAQDIADIFEQAWYADFPIEEMRIVTPADLDAEPTGDGNNTSSFVCRAVTGGSRFSEHAYGLAVDINPFHNPYVRGDLVLPELADSYLQRDDLRVGMLTAASPVVQAFKDIGWFWGGEWNSLKDWQHFSHNGQ